MIWVMMLISPCLVSRQRCVNEKMKSRCGTCSPSPPQMGAMFAPIFGIINRRAVHLLYGG